MGDTSFGQRLQGHSLYHIICALGELMRYVGGADSRVSIGHRKADMLDASAEAIMPAGVVMRMA